MRRKISTNQKSNCLGINRTLIFDVPLSNLDLPHNKRMQSDQNARYTFILTADAKRYKARRETK